MKRFAIACFFSFSACSSPQTCPAPVACPEVPACPEPVIGLDASIVERDFLILDTRFDLCRLAGVTTFNRILEAASAISSAVGSAVAMSIAESFPLFDRACTLPSRSDDR
jgi:hypothetical protein